MPDFDDFEDSDLSDFKQGVEDVSNLPVVHIDPNAFEGLDLDLAEGKGVERKDITPEHADIMRDMLESQSPGITSNISDGSMIDTVVKVLESGPSSVPITDANGASICVVTGIHDSISSESDLKQALSGGGLKDTGSIEADLSDIKYAVGAHEGEHCNQDVAGISELKGAEKDAAILEGEINADKKAIDALEENRGVDITEDLTAMRNLDGASDGGTHATGISLDDTTPIELSDDQAYAAANFINIQDEAVKEELGISESELTALKVSDGDKYNETVDKLLDNGTFNADLDPDANEYVEDYIKAQRDEEIKQQELEEQQRLEEQANSESQINLETEQLAQEERDLEEQELAQQEVEQLEIEQQEIAQLEQDQQLQQEQDAALANDTSMATSAPNLLAVTNVITTPSSDSLAGIVPLGAGVAMVHGDDIADKSSIEAGGEPVGAYFDGAANETAALDRIQQAQDMQNAMANAPAPTDPNINNPIGGMSAPAAPSASA